jgi:hypothetical protein
MVRGRTDEFLIRLTSGNIKFQAQALLQNRYPRCVVLQVISK